MTREDAIKRLEDTFEAWEGWIPHNDSPASKLSEALGMAIAALREQETVTNRNGLNRTESNTVKVVEIDQFTRNLHDVASTVQPEASNQQVTEPLQHNGFSDSEPSLATKNQVTSDKTSDKNSNTDQRSSNTDNALTNADHYRSMTDEELAVEIMCPYHIEPEMCNRTDTCVACCLEWLKQPYREEV